MKNTTLNFLAATVLTELVVLATLLGHAAFAYQSTDDVVPNETKSTYTKVQETEVPVETEEFQHSIATQEAKEQALPDTEIEEMEEMEVAVPNDDYSIEVENSSNAEAEDSSYNVAVPNDDYGTEVENSSNAEAIDTSNVEAVDSYSVEVLNDDYGTEVENDYNGYTEGNYDVDVEEHYSNTNTEDNYGVNTDECEWDVVGGRYVCGPDGAVG